MNVIHANHECNPDCRYELRQSGHTGVIRTAGVALQAVPVGTQGSRCIAEYQAYAAEVRLDLLRIAARVRPSGSSYNSDTSVLRYRVYPISTTIVDSHVH